MIAAFVAGGAAALAIVVLIAWLAHAALDRGDRAAAADVARAGLAAQLELAVANLSTSHAALANVTRVADAYKELLRAQPPLPGLAAGAHGVDQLLAAIDYARAILPAEPAAGADRPAGDGGGLPDGPGSDAGPDADPGPATMPDGGGPADALR